jgi:hypothetical protein
LDKKSEAKKVLKSLDIDEVKKYLAEVKQKNTQRDRTKPSKDTETESTKKPAKKVSKKKNDMGRVSSTKKGKKTKKVVDGDYIASDELLFSPNN